MPTSYTAPLYEGEPITFEQFVMRCARGMGALIAMRDEPLTAPIPVAFEPSSYHADRAREARDRLNEVMDWTDVQADQAARESYNQAVTNARNAEFDAYGLRKRYETMIERVEAWEPPTPDHVGLKEFMLDQLRESMRFDGGFSPIAPEQIPGPAFREREIERLNREVGYHEAEYEKEVERIRERNAWLAALRESLEGVPA